MEDSINNYWAGHLSGKELEAFNTRLQQDKAFREKVVLYKAANEMVLDTDTPQFIALLEKTEKKIQSTPPIITLQKIMAIAASTTLLLFAGYFLFLSKPSTDNLYTKFTSQHQSVTLALIQKGSDATNAIQLEQAYKKRDYQTTLQLANQYLAQQQKFSVLLVKGICLLELNRFNEAIITFETLYNSDALIAPQGLWYQAMTYLKQGDKKSCQIVLQEIIQKQSYNHQKAVAILKSLE